MCTLAVAFDPDAAWPLVVAANRDEMLDRPSRPPFLWPGTPPILAPRDERAGGSWIGFNQAGLFVGITNRAGDILPDPSRASRGALVIDALRASSAAAVSARLRALAPQHYNPFHLLYADARSAHLTWDDGAEIHHQDLSPGLHVVTERSFGGDDSGREALVRSLWPATPDPQALHRLLSTHRPDALGSLCIHVPGFNYGTRSSAVILLASGKAKLWWTEGSPCTTPQVEVPVPFELRSIP